MTTWEVLGFDGESAWVVEGSIESEYSYGPGHDAVGEIGRRYGAGSYLLLNNASGNFVRLTVAARTEFYEVSVEEAEPEPLSAAAVMERDG